MKIQEQIAKTEARLKLLKEQSKALKARERQREQAQARKDDTRRKILIGSFYLSKMKDDDGFALKVKQQLDKYLTAERDRNLFDLKPAGENNE